MSNDARHMITWAIWIVAPSESPPLGLRLIRLRWRKVLWPRLVFDELRTRLHMLANKSIVPPYIAHSTQSTTPWSPSTTTMLDGRLVHHAAYRCLVHAPIADKLEVVGELPEGAVLAAHLSSGCDWHDTCTHTHMMHRCRGSVYLGNGCLWHDICTHKHTDHEHAAGRTGRSQM